MDERLCRVWVADVAWRRPAHDPLLDRTERTRAGAFARPIDRTRFVLGAAMVRLAVAVELNVKATAVRLDRRCAACGAGHGKPRVEGSLVHVSVAHSGARVLVAVTSSAHVGVDVEERAARAAVPRARDVLASTEPLRGSGDFLTYWCRKESVVKAMGVGLTVPLREVVVSPANDPARLVSYGGAPLPAHMADLDVGREYAAAVTVLTPEHVSVEIVSAEALLLDSLYPGRPSQRLP